MPAPTSGVKSHSGRRQSRNKKHDPFLDLPDDLDVLKQHATSSPSPSESGQHVSHQSLLADLILTPIGVISFILSLFVVERQQRQWRYQNHAHPSQAQSGRWFSSPEPYQDAKGATWHPRLSWRRRGIAKMQINEVLEMRGRVVLSIAVWMAIGVLAIAYGARRLYYWAFA